MVDLGGEASEQDDLPRRTSEDGPGGLATWGGTVGGQPSKIRVGIPHTSSKTSSSPSLSKAPSIRSPVTVGTVLSGSNAGGGASRIHHSAIVWLHLCRAPPCKSQPKWPLKPQESARSTRGANVRRCARGWPGVWIHTRKPLKHPQHHLAGQESFMRCRPTYCTEGRRCIAEIIGIQNGMPYRALIQVQQT